MSPTTTTSAAASKARGGPPAAALPRAPITTPAAVFLLTYLTWASIHAARKSYSVIKPTLLKEEWLTTPLLDRVAAKGALSTSERLSVPDTAFFLAFALSTLWKGPISDRGDPRVIMAASLAGCSLLLALFGLGYYFRIHPTLYYGLLWALQAFGQALVWPGAVRVMGDWFAGTCTRNLFMGLWCSSNNVGNMLGTGVGALGAVALGSGVWGAPLLVLAALLLGVSWLVYARLTTRPELVGRAAYRWSLGAREELSEAFGTASVDYEEEEEEEGEHVIAFGPASPMVRPDDEGWEERRRPLLEPVSGEAAGEAAAEAVGSDERQPPQSMSMWRALWLPGVVEVSLSYAALKGTAYALFFWLPTFLSASYGLSVRDANLMAMLFDCGQLTGSPAVGLLSSRGRRPHLINFVCILASAIPIALLYALEGQAASRGGVGVLLFLAGAFSGGPQNLIATAVCQEIGSYGHAAAVATVASVVDGIGSLGAAVIQMLVGHLATCHPKEGEGDGADKSCDLDGVFVLLVAGSLLAAFALVRLVVVEHRDRANL